MVTPACAGDQNSARWALTRVLARKGEEGCVSFAEKSVAVPRAKCLLVLGEGGGRAVSG